MTTMPSGMALAKSLAAPSSARIHGRNAAGDGGLSVIRHNIRQMRLCYGPAPSRRALVGCFHTNRNAAAHLEIADDLARNRIERRDEIVQDAIGDVLVKMAFVAE